jgi:hypothetical protein
MRPKWAVVLLLVSLLGNVAELARYGVRMRIVREPVNGSYRWVRANVSRYGPQVVVESFEPKMRLLERRKHRWTVESRYQSYQQPPDTAIDRITLDSVASITRQAFELIHQSRRALPQTEDAGLRKRMEKRWRQQMGIGD